MDIRRDRYGNARLAAESRFSHGSPASAFAGTAGIHGNGYTADDADAHPDTDAYRNAIYDGILAASRIHDQGLQ